LLRADALARGFSGQFIDYEIDPRFPSDIRQPGH
jgi:hypothetical protein